MQRTDIFGIGCRKGFCTQRGGGGILEPHAQSKRNSRAACTEEFQNLVHKRVHVLEPHARRNRNATVRHTGGVWSPTQSHRSCRIPVYSRVLEPRVLGNSTRKVAEIPELYVQGDSRTS